MNNFLTTARESVINMMSSGCHGRTVHSESRRASADPEPMAGPSLNGPKEKDFRLLYPWTDSTLATEYLAASRLAHQALDGRAGHNSESRRRLPTQQFRQCGFYSHVLTWKRQCLVALLLLTFTSASLSSLAYLGNFVDSFR